MLKYTMQVEELYYHNSNCEDTTVATDAYRGYLNNKRVMIPSCSDWVLLLVDHVNAHPKAGWYAGKNMSKKDITRLNKNNPDMNLESLGVRKRKVQETGWGPFGESINFNNPEYRYDDRAYLLLPGHPVKNILSWKSHRMSMGRLLYLMVVALGIEEEVSPFSIDEDRFVDMQEKKLFGRNQKRDFKNLWRKREEGGHHIMLREISVLSGGNKREVAVHQYCHRDSYSAEEMSNTDRFAPGSFIIPLTEEGRDLYVGSPEANTIHIPFGKMLIFHAHLPHGGITHRFLKNGKMWPTIHGHIDSKFVKRVPGLLDLEIDGKFYYKKEHLMLYDLDQHAKIILGKARNLLEVMKDFKKHRGGDFEVMCTEINEKPKKEKKGSKVLELQVLMEKLQRAELLK